MLKRKASLQREAFWYMVRPAAEDVRIAPVLHKSINYDRLCYGVDNYMEV